MFAPYTCRVARSKEPGALSTAPSETASESRVGGKGGRYHHGDLRRALLDAALELVKEHGPSGITLREAARRAGVTHAAPYRHFTDKEALLASLAEEGFRRLRSEIEAAISDGSGLLRSEAIGVAYVRFARRNPSQFRVMFGSEIGDKRRYPSLMQADQAVFDLLSQAIRTAQEAGELPPGNPARMGLVSWSMLHGVASLVVDGQMERAGVPDDAIEDFARRVARTASAGMKQWPQTK
jgi:AcrR family transcriptional regulator